MFGIFTDQDASNLTVQWGAICKALLYFLVHRALRGKCECSVGLTGRLQMALPSTEATALHFLTYPSHTKDRKLEWKERELFEGKPRGQGREAGFAEGPHSTLGQKPLRMSASHRSHR